MQNNPFTATKKFFRADHDIFHVIGSDREVTVLARKRYPFEPKELWQKEYRRMLQTALSFLSAGKDEIIWAAYGALEDKSYLQGYHKEKPPKRNWTAFFIPR